MGPVRRPVLILGAGINGCALARELLLNQVPVWLVDIGDIASGTTAYSSRLIHGGLRYLEYGELDLVRESLAERTRLLRLAPQFVRPLELSIPVENRLGGFATAAARFFRWPWWPAGAATGRGRGLWVIRVGLKFYDAYAKDPVLPRHRILPAGAPDTPPVDASRYRWLCSYYDAQIAYPERFTLALVEDARRLAEAAGVEFRVLTYHEARLRGDVVEIGAAGRGGQGAVAALAPAAIVNATGAWVDQTLERLHVPARQMIGGTKGSHFFTSHAGLRAVLAGRGIYAEARDGRPIFILPLAGMTLVGTTDERFAGNPESAVATETELEYLIASVRLIFPQVDLGRQDINFHYAGVRPLPHVDASAPAAITRRHWLERHADAPLPLYSIIGGKLTTCRSLAENAARTILTELNQPVTANSQQRTVPGGESYPANEAELNATWQRLAKRLGVPPEQISRVWALYGTRTEAILSEAAQSPEIIAGTPFSCGLVRWVILHEWVRTLDDLVERRLMLLYHHPLTRESLEKLAELLAAEGILSAANIASEVERTIERLQTHFGKRIEV